MHQYVTGCHEIVVSSGSYPGEVGWDIYSDGSVIMSGGAPYDGVYCGAPPV